MGVRAFATPEVVEPSIRLGNWSTWGIRGGSKPKFLGLTLS
jgi:hypothetical protein